MRVGWAKAHFAPCPPSRVASNLVGTLRFAHPTILRPAQLIGAPDPDRRRRFAPEVGAATGSVSLSAPILRSAASAARSPLSQAPSTVPHSVSWVASPARNSGPIGSVRIFRDGWAPGPAADIAPRANGAEFQLVALVFLIAEAASLPNSFVIHSLANDTIALRSGEH